MDDDGHRSESLPASRSPDPPAAPRNERAHRVRWRRRLLRGTVSFVGLLLVAALVSALISVPYYAITPGSGINVSTLIRVPTSLSRSHDGEIFLTDVELVPLRALTYLYFELDHNAQIVSTTALTGTSSSTQYNEQGEIDMTNAREAATVAGLRALGYHVDANAAGVSVYATIAGSPAARHLSVGNVIVAVDNKSTLTVQGLRAELVSRTPGSVVVLHWHELGSSKLRRTSIRLGTEVATGPSSDPGYGCVSGALARGERVVRLGTGGPVACLGITLEQQYSSPRLPFSVTINPDGIIGPSAGLAFTLGLIQKLDRQDLTAGHRIAATGTMSIGGNVGDVGGVAQKTIAVRQAGASIFFVPPQEKAVALKNAGPRLRIIAVSTLSQAIAALEQLGGKISSPAPKS